MEFFAKIGRSDAENTNKPNRDYARLPDETKAYHRLGRRPDSSGGGALLGRELCLNADRRSNLAAGNGSPCLRRRPAGGGSPAARLGPPGRWR